MTLGVAILYAVTLGPGNKDSLFMALAAEIYAATSVVIPVSGVVSLVLLLLAASFLVLLAVIPSLGYIAIAFGSDPSTGKAATLTVAACICFFAMHLVRVRLPAIGPVGLISQLLVAVNLAPMYWSSGSPPPLNLLGTAGELLGYGLATLLLVYFFLIPLSSGPAITKLMAMLTGVVHKMGNSSDDNDDSEDTMSKLKVCMELDSQAGQLMVPLDLLLLSSKVDFNVYGKPHIFPTKAYEQLHKRIGFLSRLMVHRSRLDRSFIPGMESLHAAKLAGLESITDVLLLSSDTGACSSFGRKYTTAAAAADIQACWDKAVQNHRVLTWEVYSMMKLLESETSSTKRESIMMEGVGGWLVIKAIEELPHCFPDAKLLLLPATETVEDPPPPWTFMASEKARATLRQAMEDAYKELDQTGTTATSYNADDDKTRVPNHITSSSNYGILFKMAEATGFHRHMLILACQATGAFLIGCILTFNSTTYNALGQEVSWVFIALIVVSTITYSGALHKAGQRLVGTLIGVCFVSCVTLFNYLVAGLSYKSTSTSLALSCTLLAIYTGLMVATREAIKPHFQYACQLAIFTPPLLFPYDLGGTDSMWTKFGFRIANNLIGIGLVTVFSLMYPITTRTYIKHTVAELLQELALCVEGVSRSLGSDKAERERTLFKHNTNIEKCLLKLDQLKEELNLEKGIFFTPPQRWFQERTGQSPGLSAQQMQDEMTPLMLELRSRMVELFVASAVGSWYIAVGLYTEDDDDTNGGGMVYLTEYAQAIRTMRLFVLGRITKNQVDEEFNALELSLKQLIATGALHQENLYLVGRALFARRGIQRGRTLVTCIDSLFGQ